MLRSTVAFCHEDEGGFMLRYVYGWPAIVLCLIVFVGAVNSCARHSFPQVPRDAQISTAIVPDPRYGTSISGRVTDDHGAPLPGVSVMLESSTHSTQSAVSGPGGGFAFPDLPEGVYSVNFSIEGFTEVRQEAVRVNAGSQMRLDIILRPALSEEFTVIGETPLIDTKSSVVRYDPGQGLGTADPGINGGMGSGSIIPEDLPGNRKHSGSKASSGRTVRGYSDADQVVVIAGEDDWSRSPTQPTERYKGVLIASKKSGEALGVFPLKHTEVSAGISGYLAQTVVEQEFTNPYDQTIEAEYVFPLPCLSAVYDFVMDTGRGRIIGIVRPRAQAEEIYRAARDSGLTASLLTQVRSNVFNQKIANIEQGSSVKISVTYFERLPYKNGFYEYVFPMVVPPRYASPANAAGSSSASCASAETFTQPTSMQNTGQDVGITIQLDAGLPIAQLLSDTHPIDVQEDGSNRRTIRLSRGAAIPDRDFVLRWSVAGDATQVGVFAYKQPEEDGFFSLMIQPPLHPADAMINPREITLIMDISGSMSGLPVETSRALVEKALDRMPSQDLFNIVYFSGGNNQLWERAQPATSDAISKARGFLQTLSGGGGTEMMAALQRALSAEHDPRYLQMYVFLTDGLVTEENAILEAIQQNRGNARFFAFGIGSSVNRRLIDGIGEFGSGFSQVVLTSNPQIQEAVDSFFTTIDSPVLVDMKVNWNGLPVKDVYPKKLNDLFAGQTVSVVGKYEKEVSGRIYLEGTLNGAPVRYEIPLALPAKQTECPAMGVLWARQRIHELTARMLNADADKRAELVKKVTELALKYHLETDYTSFVAVDESRVAGDGNPRHVLQPLEKSPQEP